MCVYFVGTIVVLASTPYRRVGPVDSDSRPGGYNELTLNFFFLMMTMMTTKKDHDKIIIIIIVITRLTIFKNIPNKKIPQNGLCLKSPHISFLMRFSVFLN